MILSKSYQGFILQVFSNGLVRLLYMYLIASLAVNITNTSIEYSIALGYTTQLLPFFILSLYKYVISIANINEMCGLKSCYFQYSILFRLNIALFFLALLLMTLSYPSMYVVILASSVSLAITEVNYAIATVKKIELRAFLNFGVQFIYFLLVFLSFKKDINVEVSFLLAGMGVFLLSHIFFLRMSTKDNINPIYTSKEIKLEYLIRVKSIVGDAPVIATIPIVIFLLSNSQPDTIPVFLLFISVAGAVLFFFGNFYHYYGRFYLLKVIEIVNNGKYKKIIFYCTLIYILCILLSYIIDVIAVFLNYNLGQVIIDNWIVYVSLYITGLVITQWFSLISLHKNRIKYVLITNTIYLLVVMSLLSFFYDYFNIYIILAIASVFRMFHQIILVKHLRSA